MNDHVGERAALESFVGRTLHERYRLDAVLGHGGMGAVFRAHHLGLGRDVAIKILRPGHEGGMAGARFEREARSASRLDHPACVRVTDFGELDDGTRYLAMELVHGEQLTQRLGRPWPPTAAIDLTMRLLEGLRHAHGRGIVHRDLKPDNVLLTTDHDGRSLVKIVDFGIAKLLEDDGAHARLTRTGMRFGTPRYMSPEQAGGGKVDARTDLYAVGLLLYEMLAGRSPFEADDVATMMRLHVLTPPPPLPETVPPSLGAIVLRLLAKTRKERFDDAETTLGALRAVRAELEAPPPPAPASIPTTAAVTTPRIGVSPPWPSAMPGAQRRRPRRHPALLVGVVAILAIWLAVGIAFVVREASRETTASGLTVAPSASAPSAGRGGPATSRSSLRACVGEACACPEDQPCALECIDDCELSCSRSDGCTFACGEDCEARCTGAADCVVDVGEGSAVECDGSGLCTVSCAGQCEVSCRGSGSCRLYCRGPQAPGPRSCNRHVLACGEC